MRSWLRGVLIALLVLVLIAAFLAFSALIASRGASLGETAPFLP